MIGDNGQNASIMNSDINHDLKSKNDAIGDLSLLKEQDIERKELRKILKTIEKETGLGDINAIIDKAEQHEESYSTMNELRKTLQTKMLNLY